jgi:glycosyltransferase involved in cell wall biosynthesis
MQKPRARVAAIVPAYNEAPTIGIVVRALVKSGFLDDVIVVSVGSTDQTASVAKANGATCVLALPRNIGKGRRCSWSYAQRLRIFLAFEGSRSNIFLNHRTGYTRRCMCVWRTGRWPIRHFAFDMDSARCDVRYFLAFQKPICGDLW